MVATVASKVYPFVAIIVGFAIPTVARAADASVLAVVRPWIADSLKLTPEQRRQTLAVVVELQDQMRSVIGDYPRGGQDADGTHIRDRLEQKMKTQYVAATEQLNRLLTNEQLDQLAALAAADRPTREVTLQEGRFTALLSPPAVQPADKTGVQLTKGQRARLRAAVLQAEEDWLNEHRDPEKRLDELRLRVEQQLSEMLTDEQREHWQPLRDRERENPAHRIIYNHHWLFESIRDEVSPINLAVVRFANLRKVDGLGSRVRWRAPLENGDTGPPLWHPEDQLVSNLAVSPNGRWIITVGMSAPGVKTKPEIRLWEAQTGKLLDVVATNGKVAAASFRFFTSESVQIVLHPFGRYRRRTMSGRTRSRISMGSLVLLALATALCADEPDDSRLVRRWGGDECYVGDRLRSLSFSSDNRQLAWCGERGAAALYELERQQVVRFWPRSSGLVALNLLTEPDEALLVFGRATRCRGEIWNLRKHEKLRDVANWNGRFALSDDRQFLATEHESLWSVRDLSTGKTTGSLPTLKMNRNSASAIALSGGGRRLGFWTHNNLAVWDIETGKNVWQVTRQGPSVSHISFSSDGETMAVSRHGNIELWRTDIEGLKQSIECFYPHGSGFLHDNGQLWIAGLRRVLVAEANSGNKLLDAEILKPTSPGAGSFATLMAAASPDGKRLALSDQDRVWLWDLETLKPLEPFREGRRGVGMAAAFSQHGDRVLCSDDSNGWAQREPKADRIDGRHDGSAPVTAIAVSRTDGTVIVARQNSLEWWPAESMQPVATQSVTKATQLRFTADGTELYGLAQSRPFVYDARTGEPRPAPATIGLATAIGRDADGRWITARPNESELQMMINDKYACVPFQAGGLFGPIVFPDGRTVAAGSGGGMILWDLATCEERRRLPCRLGNPGQFPVYTVSADGSRIAAWNSDNAIHVWNTQTGDEIALLRGHRAPITALDISPDCLQIVSGSLDGSIRLWDIGPRPTPVIR